MKKKIPVLFTIIILILTVMILDALLVPKTEDGIRQAKCFYEQPENSIDVAFMGSSHIHCNINPYELYEQYGIASYDFSAAEQPLWITYYYVLELLKYQHPKVIVLDMYAPARFRDDYQYRWLNDNLAGLKLSKNKLDILEVAAEPDRRGDYFPAITFYHTRYKEIGMADIKALFESSADKEKYKGYTPYENVSPQERPALDMDSIRALTSKSEEYLNKIIELTKSEGIELYLLATPYPVKPEEQASYNYISELADKAGIIFDNTNLKYDSIGIDFDEDFSDFSHLNVKGSHKFTEYIGKELLIHYDLPDRRGMEGWESWENR